MEDLDSGNQKQEPSRGKSFRIVFVIAGLLVIPAAITLHTVTHPGVLTIDAPNPTPLGYTVSLLMFIVPILALSGWFFLRPDLSLQRNAFWWTILILAPLGFLLDLLFGNFFFTFPNKAAVIGIGVPARGGPIPIEEFVFYLAGFMIVLMSYIWADVYWLRAYNVPDYVAQTKGIPRIVRFHTPSVVLGIGLLAAAVVCKKLLAPPFTGFPWYFTYLVFASIIPSAGFFDTAKPFINSRAFSFTFFLILLVSLLWEATLAVPYGWWSYKPETMMGLTIGAWSNLPVEAVCVWFAVTFTTVITYEVVKIWHALGTGALEAFLGIKKQIK